MQNLNNLHAFACQLRGNFLNVARQGAKIKVANFPESHVFICSFFFHSFSFSKKMT